MNSKIFSLWKIASALVLIAVLSIVVTSYWKYSPNTIIKLLTNKQQDIDSFVNTIFQVQGGVATLTISMLALITGLNKEKKYGIKTLDFMMYKNKFVLNFYDEILLSLSLLILNCLFVALSMLAAVEFVLLVSVVIIVHMLYCIIKITFFSEWVDKEIREYVIGKCKESVFLENSSTKH